MKTKKLITVLSFLFAVTGLNAQHTSTMEELGTLLESDYTLQSVNQDENVILISGAK